MAASTSGDGRDGRPERGGGTARLFVGRARELSELTLGLEEARSGRGSLYLLSGAPGIGKTRLAKEVAELAARREARVLWGHPWDGGGQPAYWPWVQILRAYVRSEEPVALAPNLEAGAHYVGQLVPELQAYLPRLSDGAPARLDSDNARFYLFDAVTEFLRRGTARHPLVIVLDGLHAADLSSLLLLQFLAADLHETRILAIGTYCGEEARRAPEVASLLADLGRASRRIALGGLAEPDIALLIEESAGIVPSPELAAAVHRVTEGNPLFADEIVRLLAAEGRLHSPEALGTKLRLPDGVREAIRRRLAPLPQKCLELLSVAAVADHEFEARLLEAVSDRPMEQVAQVLDDAVAAGIIEQVSPAFGRFRFSHALIRDTLYEDISSIRRQLLHRSIGEILERMHGGQLERHVSELAHHFCRAAPSGVAEKAVHYAVRAGKRAMSLLAYEEAIRGFELALHALDLVAERREDSRCDVLLGLGTAQGASGDRATSQGTFVKAADAARAAGNIEKLAIAAMGLGRQSAFDEVFEAPRKTHPALIPLLEEALAALRVEDSPLRARLLSRLATALFWKRDSHERMRTLVREAVEMAERLGDGGALAEALTNRRIALIGPGCAEERLADASRVVRLAAEMGDQERELQSRKARLYDLLELGDADSADVEIERIGELARVLRQPCYLADTGTIRAMRTLMDGRLDEGRDLAEHALELNQRVRPEIAATLYGGQMFRTVWREKGQLAELEQGMKAILEQEAPMPAASSALAFMRSEQGKREDARAEFERVAADLASIPCELAWTAVMANLSEVCCVLGDLPRARAFYAALLPFAAMNIVLGPVPYACWGPIAHHLGMLAATLGETTRAQEHFERALEMEAKMRMPGIRARTQYEYGRMLVWKGSRDDAKRGTELLAAALESARWLGMSALERELSASLAELLSESTTRVAETATEPSLECDIFRLEGEYWTIAYEGQTFRLRDTKGLAYLAELLHNPAREFLALDLIRAGGDREGGEFPRLGLGSLGAGDPGDAGPLLDGEARAAYRERIEDLREELGEAERANDLRRASKARDEIDVLTRELARAVGLGGRERRAASAVERARQSVTIAIRTTVKKISEASPALGRHLAATVKTGKFCAYTPDPRASSSWRA